VGPEAAARQHLKKKCTRRLDWAGLLRGTFALDTFRVRQVWGQAHSAAGRRRGGAAALATRAQGGPSGRMLGSGGNRSRVGAVPEVHFAAAVAGRRAEVDSTGRSLLGSAELADWAPGQLVLPTSRPNRSDRTVSTCGQSLVRSARWR
jgi:hypothetical protein